MSTVENQNQKWVNLGYLALAALVAYVFFLGGLKISAFWDLEARIRKIELIIRVAALVAGGLVFALLYSNRKANLFMTEVVEELSKVSWPTQKETTSSTAIVIVMVVLSGLVLGLLDYVWTRLLQLVLV